MQREEVALYSVSISEAGGSQWFIYEAKQWKMLWQIYKRKYYFLENVMSQEGYCCTTVNLLECKKEPYRYYKNYRSKIEIQSGKFAVVFSVSAFFTNGWPMGRNNRYNKGIDFIQYEVHSMYW